MKRLNLVAYGFERVSEADFRDDGTQFRCYRYKGFIVSVAKYKDEFYISTKYYKVSPYLSYEICSKLPGFNDIDILNGVKADSVSVISIEALKRSIETYAKAYAEAANN